MALVKEISGVIAKPRRLFGDSRGWVEVAFDYEALAKDSGIVEWTTAQTVHSLSFNSVMRGIHIAAFPKFATVIRGKVLQVVVDCRLGSPTFGDHVKFINWQAEPLSITIPAHCGNAFAVLDGPVDYIYSMARIWVEGCEREVNLFDPTLAIEWPEGPHDLSDRDKSAPSFAEVYGKTPPK